MREEYYVVVALSLYSALALCGCGSGSSGGGVANATLQVLQEDASEGTISVSLNGQVISGGLAYQQNSGPITVKSGSGTLVISGPGVAGPSGSDTLNTPVEFAENGHYTFVTDGFGVFSSASILLTNDTTPAGNSNVKLRIVNCAITDTSAVDVYVLPFGQIPSGTPTLSKLAYNANGNGGTAPSYQSVSAGDYDIYFTVIGSTQVLYHTGQLTFSADQNRTAGNYLSGCTVARLVQYLNGVPGRQRRGRGFGLWPCCMACPMCCPRSTVNLQVPCRRDMPRISHGFLTYLPLKRIPGRQREASRRGLPIWLFFHACRVHSEVPPSHLAVLCHMYMAW